MSDDPKKTIVNVKIDGSAMDKEGRAALADELTTILREHVERPDQVQLSENSTLHPLALTHICEHPWLILESALQTIVSIARTGAGENYRPQASGNLFDAIGIEARAAPIVRDRTAIISIDGPIFPKGNMVTRSSGATSLRMLEQEFAAAVNDSAIERIILLIDSPGGVSTGVQALGEQIFEARAKKHITAIAQDMSASAALWLATAATEFIVTPAARAGSIGVVLTAHRRGGDDPDAIEIVSTQSPLKRQNAGSESGRASLQAWADSLAEVFIQAVARNRGVDARTVLERFGRGATMSGAEAVAVGLADRLGTLEQVIAGLSGNQPQRRSSMSSTQEKPAITRESIAAEQPAIAEAFKKEGHEVGYKAGLEAGRTAGAEQERARIKSLDDLPHAGHEPLIAQIKADGKTTAAEAALQILHAERTARTTALGQRRAEAPAPVKTAALPANEQRQEAATDTRSIETRTKEAWENDPALRAEFADDFDRFFAYEQATANGQVRVFNPGAARK